MKSYKRKMAIKNDCAIESALNIISDKWKPGILSRMLDGQPVRPSMLLRESPDLTRKVLLQQLGELESAGIVVKTTYAEVPPKVEYSLTSLGASLKPVLESLHKWGTMYNASHITG